MHFDLSDMVNDFGVDVQIVRRTNGYYDEWGDWIDGELETTTIKAILSNNTDDTMTYYDSGSLHSDFYKVYTNVPLRRDDKLLYNDDAYTLFDHRDYDTLAIPHIYFVKRRDKDELDN